MSNEPKETLHYPSPQVVQDDEGGLKMDYIKSGRGILNFSIMGFLFLGFVCAVSLKLSSAKLVDACIQTTVKINVRASNVAYMFFVVLTLVIFAFLALLNSVSISMLANIRALLPKIMVVGLIMVLTFILFIVSSTQCASEHKVSQSNSADRCAIIRPGGPGASCFFGYMAVISMIIFAAMTFKE